MEYNWISVKDILQKVNIRVLGITESKDQYVVWRTKDDTFEYSDCCKCYCGEITHWQPVPEPPKE